MKLTAKEQALRIFPTIRVDYLSQNSSENMSFADFSFNVIQEYQDTLLTVERMRDEETVYPQGEYEANVDSDEFHERYTILDSDLLQAQIELEARIVNEETSERKEINDLLAANPNPHKWMNPKDYGFNNLGDYESCKDCMVVRPRDQVRSVTGVCKGKVQVSLRST